LTVNVKQTTTELDLESDETYKLNLQGPGQDNTLESETIWGALRGLETFSQLVLQSKECGSEIEVLYF